MGQMMMTDVVSPQPKEGRMQLTAHRKVTSVDPGPKIVSPVAVKDILSTSGPVNTTFTSSTDRSYTKQSVK